MYLITAQGLDSKIFEAKKPDPINFLWAIKYLKQAGGKKYVEDHLSELLQALR